MHECILATPVTTPHYLFASMIFNEAAIILFCDELKTYGDFTYSNRSKEVTENMVIGFNHELFTNLVSPDSPLHNASICNFHSIGNHLFKPNEKWINRDLLKTVCDLIAKYEGWDAALVKTKIICNRSGEERVRSINGVARSTQAGPLKKKCGWDVTISSLVKEAYVPEGSKTKKLRYKDQWEMPVVVVSSSSCHTNGCVPCRANRLSVTQSSGNYVRKLPTRAIFTLCNYADQGIKLTHQLIKAVISPLWPKHKHISGKDTFSVRVKVLRAKQHFTSTDKDYEAFQEIVNDSDLLSGIDDQTALEDDEAYELACVICEEVLATTDNLEDAIFSFVEYLDLIADRAKGFSYKVVSETKGSNKKLLGLFWMTATMRRNFELFGSFICLDMMKRGINTLLWPYCAVTMIDESNHVCVACEGIVCGERQDMYAAQADFLKEFAPGRSLNEVMMVAGDGFFDQSVIKKMGFTNARFIQDHFHLYDSGLKKIFGPAGYELLKSHLVRMIQAKSEGDFDEIYVAGKNLLENQSKVNGQLLSIFEKFASSRANYAEFCIAEIPGNRGRKGSPISESNHSSVLSYLNDGVKGTNR